MPWLVKAGEDLWFSTGNTIRCYETQHRTHVREDGSRCLFGMKEDATKFVAKNGHVVSGCRDGSVHCWSTSGSHLYTYKDVHVNDAQCVDFTDKIIITGSRDASCKILPFECPSNVDDVVLRSFNTRERIWSLKISPCEKLFATGLAGCLTRHAPVILWDIESGECEAELSENHKPGAGILDLKFESPFELLTCGYDTIIRLWDLRTNSCVMQWEEPHDSALYCLDSDGGHLMAVGTARHGLVRLWDKRKTEPLQSYYSHKLHSPVYGIAMDFRRLFLAVDFGLNVFDFTSGEPKPNKIKVAGKQNKSPASYNYHRWQRHH